jgi:hypothetical protein
MAGIDTIYGVAAISHRSEFYRFVNIFENVLTIRIPITAFQDTGIEVELERPITRITEFFSFRHKI